LHKKETEIISNEIFFMLDLLVQIFKSV